MAGMPHSVCMYGCTRMHACVLYMDADVYSHPYHTIISPVVQHVRTLPRDDRLDMHLIQYTHRTMYHILLSQARGDQ